MNNNNNKLEKRYGLFVAICMIVGIVIGSGVFFKSQDILAYTNNNVLLGVLAWVIGGLVMIGCAIMFVKFAGKYSRVNGMLDYAETIVGPKYTYFFGCFLTYIYYPAMTGVLGWVSARYTLELFGQTDVTSTATLILSLTYILVIYLFNVVAPKLSGKFQVSATIIKLIPIGLIAIVGTIAGLINGNTSAAFELSKLGGENNTIFRAIVACAFAYEGWIIATSINAELKNPKKNLPIALIIGCLIIMGVYILFFIGIFSANNLPKYILSGSKGDLSLLAASSLFGNIGGTLLKVFIVVSCVGTLNGLTIANIRAKYSIAVRNQGIAPALFSKLSKKLNMPIYSSICGVVLSIIWFLYFFFGTLQSKFGVFNFDSSELPIVTIYAFYIPLFIGYMIKDLKENSNNKFKVMILPIIATLCSLFMVFCAVYSHGIQVVYYLIVFIVIMVWSILENIETLKEYKCPEEDKD